MIRVQKAYGRTCGVMEYCDTRSIRLEDDNRRNVLGVLPHTLHTPWAVVVVSTDGPVFPGGPYSVDRIKNTVNNRRVRRRAGLHLYLIDKAQYESQL